MNINYHYYILNNAVMTCIMPEANRASRTCAVPWDNTAMHYAFTTKNGDLAATVGLFIYAHSSK